MAGSLLQRRAHQRLFERHPVGGQILVLKRVPGRFKSLKHFDSLLEYERKTMVIGNGEFKVGMVQIASRLVRRITSYVEQGAMVKAGQKVGMIQFGSQVDLLIPLRDSMKMKIAIGQNLFAGESVIAAYEPGGGKNDHV